MRSMSVIKQFYDAFARHDAEAMVALYHDDVVFHDPVFLELRGERARGMWRMLVSRATDLVVEATVGADGLSAHWEATYTFTATGRKVHNVIDATFELDGGKIRRHTDRFGLWRWARQALGPSGVLLGWSPIVQGPIRRGAAKSLDAYLAKSGR
jgi:ketosteroid isomerase-like protein